MCVLCLWLCGGSCVLDLCLVVFLLASVRFVVCVCICCCLKCGVVLLVVVVCWCFVWICVFADVGVALVRCL